ncbi:hypothetical protein AB4376_13065 [Vibrio breoganii]
MKYKVIALAVSGALLAACGSDNDNYVEPTSTPVQAFDGAVRFLDAYLECNELGFDYIGETGNKGLIDIPKGFNTTFDEDPSQCVLEFGDNIPEYGNGGTNKAIDESNSKDMSNVRYLVPPQLLSSGGSIAATPHSTLIALKIFEAEDTGETVDLDAIIRETFVSTLPENTDFDEFDLDEMKEYLSDPESTLNDLDSETSKNLQASTMILSDAIAGSVAADALDISKLETSTQSAATDLASNPGFPKNDDGKPTYVELSSDFESYFDGTTTTPPSAPTDPDNLTPGEELDPIEDIPTGGTGGTAG